MTHGFGYFPLIEINKPSLNINTITKESLEEMKQKEKYSLNVNAIIDYFFRTKFILTIDL